MMPRVVVAEWAQGRQGAVTAARLPERLSIPFPQCATADDTARHGEGKSLVRAIRLERESVIRGCARGRLPGLPPSGVNF
jgi:hypothetical protein